MKYFMLLCASLLLTCSAFAWQKPVPGEMAKYLIAHARAWNDGWVCRHAAADLARMARTAGLEYRVPQFDTTHPKFDHVAISIRYRGTWYHIDSIMDEPGRYNPVCRASSLYDPARQLKMFRELTRRDLTRYIKDIDEETLDCWFDRCDMDVNRKIDDRLVQVRDIKEFLAKWVRIFREAASGFSKDPD